MVSFIGEYLFASTEVPSASIREAHRIRRPVSAESGYRRGAPGGYTPPVRALILFAHGSLLCGSGEALDAHADRLRALGLADRVAVGYLNYTEPSFAATVDALAAEGVTEVRVLPYFLAPGYFVTHALPECLDAAKAKHPEIAFTVAEPMGGDPRWIDAVLEAAAAARGPQTWGEPVARAGRACRNLPECPLYGTRDCPATAGGKTP